MPASQVKRGMKGYGYTTLEGIERQKFNFEVRAVMEGYWPKARMIIIEMEGDIINQAGIIAGMSGSPVYIDDKWVGAVAYGWSYSKIPLAGVTPAEYMVEVGEYDRQRAEEQTAAHKAHRLEVMRRRSRELADLLTSPEGEKLSNRELSHRMAEVILLPPRRRGAGRLLAKPLPDGLRDAGLGITRSGFRRLALPLAVSGISRSASFTIPLLEKSGFLPVQAGGSGGGPGPDPEIAPGVPVGAAMVKGDMEMFGSGTLTAVRGNRILAFGHDMDGTGHTDYPLALGKGALVVPSVQRSFRMCSIGKIIGRIVEDRHAAIVARLDERSPMFPCTVDVRGAFDKHYEYDIASHWQMAPMLAYAAVSESIARSEASGELFTVRARARINIKDRTEPITMENTYNSRSPSMPAMDLVSLPLDLLLFNSFKKATLESVEFEVDIEPGYRGALIESVRVDRNEATPGDTVTLHVVLRKYRDERVARDIPLDIPENAVPGTEVKLLVCDGQRSLALKMSRDPGFFEPEDFEGLIEGLETLPNNASIYVHAGFTRRGLRYEGEAMPDLPQSALRMLQSAGQAGRVNPLVEDVKQEMETPWVVEGSRSVTVRIVEPEKGVPNPY